MDKEEQLGQLQLENPAYGITLQLWEDEILFITRLLQSVPFKTKHP